MADVFLLDPERTDALRAIGLETPDDLFALGGDPTAHRFGARVTLEGGGEVLVGYCKRYHYPTWSKAKGLMGRGTVWGRAPEVNEFEQLTWLRAHDIPAVRPLAAASRRVRGRLVAHALLTEWIDEARDLATRLRDPEDAWHTDRRLRLDTLQTVGASLARMHARDFVHRDARPRNLLVQGGAADARIWWIDCRRGGRGGRRPPIHDLATFDHDWTGLASRTDRLRALRAYEPDRMRRRALLDRIRREQVGLPAPRA